MMSGGNTREAKALLKMSENSCTKRKTHYFPFCMQWNQIALTLSNPPIPICLKSQSGLMMDTWALSLWVGGARSCDGHVTQVTMVIHLPSVPSNELDGGILKHEKVKNWKSFVMPKHSSPLLSSFLTTLFTKLMYICNNIVTISL